MFCTYKCLKKCPLFQHSLQTDGLFSMPNDYSAGRADLQTEWLFPPVNYSAEL